MKKRVSTEKKPYARMRELSPALSSKVPSRGIFVKKEVLTKRQGRSKIGVRPSALSSKVPSRRVFDSRKPVVLIDGENFAHRMMQKMRAIVIDNKRIEGAFRG